MSQVDEKEGHKQMMINEIIGHEKSNDAADIQQSSTAN